MNAAEVWAFVQKSPNYFYVVACLVSGTMLLWPLVSRAWNRGKEVSAMEAVQLINRRDALIVDVSDEGEFRSGHLPNARHIPLAQLKERAKELEKHKDKPIVVSCRTGLRSQGAVGILEGAGFGEVFSLKGGVTAWKQASMPTEKS